MDDLIKNVAERAGINPAQAQKAIETVLEQLEGRLPEPVASQVRGILAGGSSAGGDAGDAVKDAAKKLGGMFGR